MNVFDTFCIEPRDGLSKYTRKENTGIFVVNLMKTMFTINLGKLNLFGGFCGPHGLFLRGKPRFSWSRVRQKISDIFFNPKKFSR